MFKLRPQRHADHNIVRATALVCQRGLVERRTSGQRMPFAANASNNEMGQNTASQRYPLAKPGPRLGHDFRQGRLQRQTTLNRDAPDLLARVGAFPGHQYGVTDDIQNVTAMAHGDIGHAAKIAIQDR